MVAEGRPSLPPGSMYTQVLTQAMLDECTRALGRPLFEREVRWLDRVLTKQARLAAKDKASTDRIVAELTRVANSH